MNIKPNIIDNSTYKLDVQVTWLPHPPGQYQVVIARWIPEHGWDETELFLSEQELDNLKQAICNR